MFEDALGRAAFGGWTKAGKGRGSKGGHSKERHLKEKKGTKEEGSKGWVRINPATAHPFCYVWALKGGGEGKAGFAALPGGWRANRN